jgi:ABC-type enterochelin transport system permease subunit
VAAIVIVVALIGSLGVVVIYMRLLERIPKKWRPTVVGLVIILSAVVEAVGAVVSKG